MTAPPPLTTTLDELAHAAAVVVETEKQFRGATSNTFYQRLEPFRKAVSDLDYALQKHELAQPAPPAEALRLLRALLASHDALEDGLASFDLHNDAVTNLESVTIEARRYLAATEEGTP